MATEKKDQTLDELSDKYDLDRLPHFPYQFSLDGENIGKHKNHA